MTALLAAVPLRYTTGSPAGAAQARSTAANVLSIGYGDSLRVSAIGQVITMQLANRAHLYLQQRMTIGRQVPLHVKTIDSYGRLVTEVFSGININLALVEDGQAFAYRQYLSGCDAKEYLDAEYRASRRRYGVWHVPGGITRPWDFRRARRSAVIPDGTTPGGRRYRCSEISSYAKAQELLRQGHSYLDGNDDGEACEMLRR